MINGVRFNQDSSLFTIAHSAGFKIYQSDPLIACGGQELGADHGVRVACVLNRTNYFGLAGEGGAFPETRVSVWNQRNATQTSIDFPSRVLNVLICHDAIVAVLERSVHVVTLAAPHRELSKFDTHVNPFGTAALFNNTLVVPDNVVGEIAIYEISADKCELVASKQCHRSAVRAIAVNSDYIATASTKGTLIRVEDRHSAETRLFRRGLDKATVWSLALSKTRLACLSDKATLHVFSLIPEPHNGKEGPKHKSKDEVKDESKDGSTDVKDDAKDASKDKLPESSPDVEQCADVTPSPPAELIGEHDSDIPAITPNERHALAKVPFVPRYFGNEWSSMRSKVLKKTQGVLGWVSEDVLVLLRPEEVQWEKYVVSDKLMLEAYSVIR